MTLASQLIKTCLQKNLGSTHFTGNVALLDITSEELVLSSYAKVNARSGEIILVENGHNEQLKKLAQTKRLYKIILSNLPDPILKPSFMGKGLFIVFHSGRVNIHHLDYKNKIDFAVTPIVTPKGRIGIIGLEDDYY